MATQSDGDITRLAAVGTGDPQPGHEELLEFLEKKCNGCSSTIHSTEVNVSQEEAGDSNHPQSNDQVVPTDLEECHDEPKDLELNYLLEDSEADQRPAGRQKCGQCCRIVKKWCSDHKSKVFGCIALASTIFCLGLGITQLTIGGMGAAAPASPNNTFYCGNVESPFNLPVKGFLICVAISLISCGLVIVVWVLIPQWFFVVHKCVTYTLISIITVLVIVLALSILAVAVFFIITAVVVFGNFSSISVYHCNLGFLVMYYWAFAEIVTILSLIGLFIIVAIVALFYAMMYL